MDYNPHSPQNIGMEWVPVRQANYIPDNFNERGYVMRIDHSALVVSGHIGINDLAPQLTAGIAECINVYPEGSVLDAGPVRKVTIPLDALTITGTAWAAISPTAAAVDALTNPNDFGYVSVLDTAGPGDKLGLNFDVSSYQAELNNKRILNVRMIYTAAAETDIRALNTMQVEIARQANNIEEFNYQTGLEGAVSDGFVFSLSLNTNYHYVDFGDWNPLWAPGQYSTNGANVFPWRWTELNQLDASTSIASRLQVVITKSLNNGLYGLARIGYVALEVFYCEETRVAYGGRRPIIQGFPLGVAQIGQYFMQLKDTSFTTGKTLTPGNYVVTSTHRAISNYVSAKFPPTYAGIRQFPVDPPPVVGKILIPSLTVSDPAIVAENTDVITDIGLYTAVAAVTGTHLYSNQVQAPVFSGITAIQDVHVRPEVTTGTQYTQVRFYARKYGNVQKLTVANGAFTASITPSEFDALSEIIDGWKEVTLRLSSAIALTSDSDNPFTWTSNSPNPGDQWQILGASLFPTVGGNPNPSHASYDPPRGTTIELTWKKPNNTATIVDQFADATIILAQDLPAPTSLAISVASLAVTGVGVNCGVPNGCIPTGIKYNSVTWNPIATCDEYTRVVASGWGVMTTGETWVLTSFTGTASVDGTHGVVSHGAVNSTFQATVNLGVTDQDLKVDVSSSVVTTGATIIQRLLGRYTDTNNYYFATLVYNTTGLVDLTLSKVVAGVTTTLATVSSFSAYTAGSWFTMRLRIVGGWLYTKAWNIDASEPTSWMAIVQDTSLTTGTSVGVQSRLTTGNTNALPVTTYFDNFVGVDARYFNGRIEVQRQDDLTTWQTIMLTSNICVTGIADLEARVGMRSDYRVRSVDALGFAGPWVTGAATLTAPGVTTTGSGNSVLIFTSNYAPNSSLAYPMTWQGSPVEVFAFPEADTQVFQRMYGRDFQVAFRPLERGGETFDRVILVQAAAIPVPSLADFKGLRDLAWQDLPYVCVRDELGNRWFANVLVPAGEAKRNRRLYLAQIRVTEVTDEAAPVP